MSERSCFGHYADPGCPTCDVGPDCEAEYEAQVQAMLAVPDPRTGILTQGFMSRPDGRIDPDILRRDIELHVAFELLQAKYEGEIQRATESDQRIAELERELREAEAIIQHAHAREQITSYPHAYYAAMVRILAKVGQTW